MTAASRQQYNASMTAEAKVAQYSGWELLQRTVEEAGVKITIMRRPVPSACDPLGFSNTIISFLDRKQTEVWLTLNESGEIVQAGHENKVRDILKGQEARGVCTECGQEFPLPIVSPKRCAEHKRRRVTLHRVLRWAALAIIGLPLGLVVLVWALLEFVLNDKWEPGVIWRSLR